MLKAHLLGYPEFKLNDEAIDNFISVKAVVLFAYLILNPRKHARDHLATLLWGEMPEKKAKSNLRQALHNLKQNFSDYLDIERQTVQFVSDSVYDVDVLVLQSARENMTDIAQLKEAVSRYQGEFLMGIIIGELTEIDDWIILTRETTRLSYIDILTALNTYYQQQWLWVEQEAILKKLLSVEPLHEESHRQLMLVYARQGKYDIALAQYQECEKFLQTELNVEPMPETQTLYERIKRARQDKWHNLPSEVSRFIGREQELKELDRLMKTPEIRLITILGTGGVGKSRLAREFASRQKYYYLDGIVYIPLASVLHEQDLEQTLVQTLKVPTGSKSPIQQLLINYLNNKEILLILDNFEHLVERSDLISLILQECRDVSMMITSRTKLNLRREHMFALDGFSVIDERENQISDAMAFVTNRIENQIANFDIATQFESLEKLCDVVDGSPLALELAINQLTSMPCDELVQVITSDIDVLQTTFRDVPKRHHSMRAVFNQSWQLLSSDEKNTLLKVVVCVGGFTLDAVREMFGISPATLKELVDKSMLSRYDMPTADGTKIRFDIHELVRQYLLEKVDDKQETTLREKHARYYAKFMNARIHAITKGEDTEANLTYWYDDLSNWLQAVFWVCEFAEIPLVEDTLKALFAVLIHNDYQQRAITLYEQLIPILEKRGRPHLVALALTKLSHCLFDTGKYELAKNYLSQSLHLNADETSSPLTAETLNVLGAIHIIEGDYTLGTDVLRQSLNLYRQLDDNKGEIRCLNSLAYTAQIQGQHNLAVEYKERLVHLARENTMPKSLLANMLSTYGYSLTAQAEYERAEDALTESLALYEEMQNKKGIAQCLFSLGGVYYGFKEFEYALDYYQQSIKLRRKIEDLHGLAYSLEGVSNIYTIQATYTEALEYSYEALQIRRQIGDRFGEAISLAHIGYVYALDDNLEKSYDYAVQSIQLACELDNTMLILYTLRDTNEMLTKSKNKILHVAVIAILLHHPAFPESEKCLVRKSDLPSLAEEHRDLLETEQRALDYFTEMKPKIIAFFQLPEQSLDIMMPKHAT